MRAYLIAFTLLIVACKKKEEPPVPTYKYMYVVYNCDSCLAFGNNEKGVRVPLGKHPLMKGQQNDSFYAPKGHDLSLEVKVLKKQQPPFTPYLFIYSDGKRVADSSGFIDTGTYKLYGKIE